MPSLLPAGWAAKQTNISVHWTLPMGRSHALWHDVLPAACQRIGRRLATALVQHAGWSGTCICRHRSVPGKNVPLCWLQLSACLSNDRARGIGLKACKGAGAHTICHACGSLLARKLGAASLPVPQMPDKRTSWYATRNSPMRPLSGDLAPMPYTGAMPPPLLPLGLAASSAAASLMSCRSEQMWEPAHDAWQATTTAGAPAAWPAPTRRGRP